VIVLAPITLFIYSAFWWYYINRELRDLGRAHNSQELGDSPGLSVLAVTLGSLIIVPPFVSAYNTCKRVQAAQRLSGERDPLNGWIALVLYVIWVTGLSLFFPIAFGYMQSELNKVWRNQNLTDPVSPGLPHPGAQAAIPVIATPAPAPAAQPGATPAPAPAAQPGATAPTAPTAPTTVAPTAPTVERAEAATPADASQTAGGPAATPANWYPDPWNQAKWRYWDGGSWTSHTAN
jgi:hypothetical protein